MDSSKLLLDFQKLSPDSVIEEIRCLTETTWEIRKEELIKILLFLKQIPSPGYNVLTDMTGVDYLVPQKRTKVVYFLQNPENYQRIQVAVFVERDEFLPSIRFLWEGADWYERELFDLFGVRFDGHPDLTRILLPDEWIGHPLRRDYDLTEEPVQFKHGVKPKVPSMIIRPPKQEKNISQLGSKNGK